VALTLDQVRQFNLPSTPLKETERRASRWREIMQHEQTEIDALAALRPADLQAIARAAVEPFFDFTLARRCEEAAQVWREQAEARIAGHPSLAAARDKIADAHAVVEDAVGALHQVQDDAQADLEADLDVESTVIPAPAARIETMAPAPLFATADEFASASLKLIAEKKYDIAEEDEG
jgi:hypothetical protein